MSAFFAVDGWTGVGRPPVAIAPQSLATEAVYVAEGEPPLPRSLPLSADAPLPDAAAAWIWSPDCAPQRVEVLHRRELPCSPATQWLKVVVRPPPRWRKGEAPPPAKVIVGPLEAWHEIPEEALPSWPLTANLEARVPVDGHSRLRLRVVGKGFGSSWQEVGAGAPTTQVSTQDAKDLSVTVVGEGGEAAHEVVAAVLEPGARRDEFWAITLGSDHGVVTLPAMPGALRLAAHFRADGLLPRRVEASVAHFPPRVRLAAGCALEGRVTAEEGGPLADVSLQAEGLLSDGLITGGVAQTDGKGQFRFPALPKAAVAVRFEAPGRERRIERYDLAGCRGLWTAPVIALAKAGVLRVHVVDEQGAGVTGAHVRSSTGPSGDSDAHGVATLAGIAKAHDLTLTAQAKGFLPYDRSVSPPIPATTELRLARAASLHGVLVDEDGGAVPDGEVVIAVGNSTKSVSAGDDGAFESDVTPGVALEIRASSPTTAERRARLEPLAAGEDRDLGQLVLTRGLEILGRVVAADSGEPVSGALVWAARGGSAAALVEWAQGATARSSTAADGTFRLAGLPFAPTTVRVEAAGFAPAERAAAPVADTSQVTLGDVALASGGSIEVHADRTLNGVARADWRGDWREDHMISASLVEGEAVIDHVPPGDSHVSVVADGKLACDGSVTVADGDVAEFDCDDARFHVDGFVSVGGHRVGPGSLVWLMPVAADSLILNHRTALGLVQQQVFGAGRPQVSVDVDAAGAFLTDQLSGGGWKVALGSHWWRRHLAARRYAPACGPPPPRPRLSRRQCPGRRPRPRREDRRRGAGGGHRERIDDAVGRRWELPAGRAARGRRAAPRLRRTALVGGSGSTDRDAGERGSAHRAHPRRRRGPATLRRRRRPTCRRRGGLRRGRRLRHEAESG